MATLVSTTRRLLIHSVRNVRDLPGAELHLMICLTSAEISHASAAKISLATLELLRNALHHAGAVQLTANLRSDPSRARQLEIVVTDRGPGIAEATPTLAPEHFGAGLNRAAAAFSTFEISNRPGGGVQAVGRLGLDSSTVKDTCPRPPSDPHAGPAAPSNDCSHRDDLLLKIRALNDQLQLRGAEIGQARHELVERNAKLEAAKLSAESAMRAQSAFLAAMSHEIRTPLNAILGVTGVLMDDLMLDGQRGHFDLILSSGEHLLSVINNILDFSKIEAGRMDLQSNPFELRHCIETALDVVTHAAHEKKLALTYDLPNEIPKKFWADGDRLRQVFVNLLGNAVKFTAEGGEVNLRVRGQASSIHKWNLECFVSDTGIGIPADRIDCLFRPFSQADSTISRNFGGTGLGLAISERLVKAMGGSISVSSTQHKGTTFSIRLELALAPPDPASTTTVSLLRAMAGKTAELRLQSPLVRTMIEQHLDAFGIKCCSSPSAPGSSSPDLVLMDFGGSNEADLPNQSSQQATNSASITIATSPISASPAHAPRTLTVPVKRGALLSELTTALGLIEPAHDRRGPDRVADEDIGSTYPLRILVAEDNSINQKVASLMLKRLGYSPIIVSNGIEAIRQVQAVDYDVILMDVCMPEVNGLEATRQIRSLTPIRKQPIILAATADISPGTQARCLESGCNAMLLKPIRVSDLVPALIRAHKTLKGH